MPRPPLPIDDSPLWLVFRELVRVAQEDGTLLRCVDSWHVWEGDESRDRLELSPSRGVCLRFTPSAAPDQWYGSEDFVVPLTVIVDICVPGTAARDLLNVQHAIRRAYRPSDPTAFLSLLSRLQSAGANTGEVRITQPNFTLATDREVPMLEARTQIQVDVRQLTE